MRKFYLLFAAMFAFSVVATAGVKNLFKQDFETVANPTDAGWTSPSLAGGMSILSDEEGYRRVSAAARKDLYLNWDDVVRDVYGDYCSFTKA